MQVDRLKIVVIGAILCAPQAIVPAVAEDLADYAKACNKAVGVKVEAFDCLKGTLVPMKGTAGKDCEKPPYLPSAACREGSRLGVQKTSADTAVVWLCRKKEVTNPGSNIFDDIAVIQTNFSNGATCFYQRLDDVDGSKVPAPEDDKTGFWMTPSKAAGEECAACHDAGLLRTPYLTQVVDGHGDKVLPKDLRKDKYWFPGKDFQGWNGNVYKIDDKKPATCTGCHAMGANAIDPDLGTSTWLGLMATGETETYHLPGKYAFWMKPGRTAPNDKDKAEAKRMSECARGKVPDCNRGPWGGQLEAVMESLKGRSLPRLQRPSGEDYPKPSEKQ